MSVAEDWEKANGEFLTVALAWLRLRLAAVPGAPTVSDQDERTAAAAMEAAVDRDSPPALVRLGELLDLSAFDRYTLLLCVAPELDPTMSGRCAEAQGGTQAGCPTFALALSVLPDPAWDVLSPHRGLRRWRLVEISQAQGQPLVTSALRADERVVNYVKGLNEVDDRLEPILTAVAHPESSLPASQLSVASALTAWWAAGAGAGVGSTYAQLLGADRESKQLVAAEASARLGLRLYRLLAGDLPSRPAELETVARLWSREHRLLGGALYLDAHDVEGEPQTVAVSRFLARTEGPVFLAAADHWRGDPQAFTAEVRRPTHAEQREAWQSALGQRSPAAPGALASQFDLNLDRIEGIARHTGPDEDAGSADEPDQRLWEACLAATRPRMDELAQRLEPKATWDDLVLPPAELALLHQIAEQIDQRSTVYQTWGFSSRMNRGLGISALFAGPSGTGKTMAAEVIANELRLNLYRIDLSAVVSKYIGETEKNLRRLFDAAEEGSALLFFDEADALFGKRSDVKDSHDRYANIETSYLLQRMESYRGLAVLTTNMRGALDQAFLRRLRFIVSFPVPGVAERRAIWSRAFPSLTPTRDLNFDRLADLPATGGMIHNICLTAAFAAASDGGVVTMPLVLNAARTEFRKLEMPFRDRDFQWQIPEAGAS